MRRSLVVAVLAATMVMAMGASGAFAGEITGNGKSLKVDDGGKWGTNLHARSFCAFSGQEDNQFFEEDGTPVDPVVKGVPAHAQSWGQIPKAIRDEIALLGEHPGMACNPNIGPPPPPG